MCLYSMHGRVCMFVCVAGDGGMYMCVCVHMCFMFPGVYDVDMQHMHGMI